MVFFISFFASENTSSVVCVSSRWLTTYIKEDIARSGLSQVSLLFKYRRDSKEAVVGTILRCITHHMAAPLSIPFESRAFLKVAAKLGVEMGSLQSTTPVLICTLRLI